MAKEKAPYPIDPLTGIALPVKLGPEDLVEPAADKLGLGTHFHHAFYFKRRPALRSAGGKAVRFSRGEILPEAMHHDAYKGSVHNLFGPPEAVPSLESEQFSVAVLAVAWVIPRGAVWLKAEDPSTPVRLSNKEHEFVSHPYVTNIEGKSDRGHAYHGHDIGRFFIEHSLQEEFLDSVVTANQKVGFLNALGANNEQRVRELGHLLIYKTLWEALKPVAITYTQAKQEGMVEPSKPDLKACVKAIVPEHEFKNYYQRIQSLLGENVEPQTATLQTGVDEVELAA